MITIRIIKDPQITDTENVEGEDEGWPSYTLPQALIVAKSTVLEDMIDNKTQTITLEKMNVTLFGILVNSFYTGRIEAADMDSLHILDLTKLTKLANEFDIADLSYETCSEIRSYFARSRGTPCNFRGLWESRIERLQNLALEELFSQNASDKKFIKEAATEVHVAEFYYLVLRRLIDMEEGKVFEPGKYGWFGNGKYLG